MGENGWIVLQWLTCTIRQILYLKAPPQLELCLNDPVSAWECRQKAHLRTHIRTPTLYLPMASPFYMQSSNDCDAVTVCATDKIHFDSEKEKTSFYRLLHSSRYWVQDTQTSRAKTELNDSTLPWIPVCCRRGGETKHTNMCVGWCKSGFSSL